MLINQPTTNTHSHIYLPSITSLPFPSESAYTNLNILVPQPNVCNIPTYAIPISQPTEVATNINTNISNIEEQEKPKKIQAVKGSWSQKEDEQLRYAVSNCHPILWDIVAEQVPGRSAIQCKERWLYRLHPEVKKTRFEKWEDDLIIKERNIHGNHWTLIANKLPGRTSCAVKNRWYSVLRNRCNSYYNY